MKIHLQFNGKDKIKLFLNGCHGCNEQKIIVKINSEDNLKKAKAEIENKTNKAIKDLSSPHLSKHQIINNLLVELSSISQRIFFPGEFQKFKKFINNNPDVDLYIDTNERQIRQKIPWETIFVGNTNDISPNGFLGCQRCIYRRKQRKALYNYDSQHYKSPFSIGFLGHAAAPLSNDELKILHHHFSGQPFTDSKSVTSPPSLELMADIYDKDILHCAGGMMTGTQNAEPVIKFDLATSSVECSNKSFNQFNPENLPFIFLNPKDSGKYCRKPEDILRFVRMLLIKKAGAIIACEFAIPAVVTYYFAKHFYEQFKLKEKTLPALIDAFKHAKQKSFNGYGCQKKELYENLYKTFAMFYSFYYV